MPTAAEQHDVSHCNRVCCNSLQVLPLVELTIAEALMQGLGEASYVISRGAQFLEGGKRQSQCREPSPAAA